MYPLICSIRATLLETVLYFRVCSHQRCSGIPRQLAFAIVAERIYPYWVVSKKGTSDNFLLVLRNICWAFRVRSGCYCRGVSKRAMVCSGKAYYYDTLFGDLWRGPSCRQSIKLSIVSQLSRVCVSYDVL